MFLLESLLDKIGHHYYCPYTSKLNYTIQTPARYEVKLDAKALISVLIAHFGSVAQYYIGASYGLYWPLMSYVANSLFCQNQPKVLLATYVANRP